MESIIEELYYGNITPAERSFRRTGEYAHILQLVARNEEKLTKTLTEAQKETFEHCMSTDATSIDGLVIKALVEQILVYDDYIEVQFKCGATVEQEYVR